jgi:hypothetical protein
MNNPSFNAADFRFGINALFPRILESTRQKDLHIFVGQILSKNLNARHPPPSDSHVRSAAFLMSRFVLQSFETYSLSVAVDMKQWRYSLSYGGNLLKHVAIYEYWGGATKLKRNDS